MNSNEIQIQCGKLENRPLSQKSWAINAAAASGKAAKVICSLNPCAQCNSDVVKCFAACKAGKGPTKGERWFCPNGPNRGEYYDAWEKIPADCWEGGNKPTEEPGT
jgi:hypothetical protein